MKLEAVNVVVAGEDEIKHSMKERLNECLSQIPIDSKTVYVIKIDIGDCSCEIAQRAVEHVRDVFLQHKELQCVFVPVGNKLPVHDIQIESIHVVKDENDL